MEKTFARAERDKIMSQRDILPPLSESPFGPFPDNYKTKGRDAPTVTAAASASGGPGAAANRKKPTGIAADTKAQQTPSTAANRHILVSHTGIGGMTVSTFKGRGAADVALKDGRFGDPKGPGKSGAFAKQRIPPTDFRHHYERGDLPLCIQHAAARTLQWKVDVAKLDYHHYLPIFVDGLREVEEPFSFVALQGCLDLLDNGGAKILPTVPQLIIPLKTALNTRHPEVLIKVMKVLQRMVMCGEFVGEALVPYYRQLLPVFNLFLTRDTKRNRTDALDRGQYKRQNVKDLMHETLNLLERTGGPDAFINIKYCISTYESCV